MLTNQVKIILFSITVILFFSIRAIAFEGNQVQCLYNYYTVDKFNIPHYHFKNLFGVVLSIENEVWTVDFSKHMKDYGLVNELNPMVQKVHSNNCVLRGQ